MRIHPTATVDPKADIGADVEIGPYTWIDSDVTLGDGCRIGPHVAIMRHSTLGKACAVHAGAVIGDLPQDLGFKPAETRVNIGDGCTLREGVTVHRGTRPGTVTRIGNQCYLMAFAHVAHNVVLGNNVIMANNVLLAGYVEVGDRAFISGHCSVHQFNRIGRLAMMGGNSAVSRDVPPFCLVAPVSLNTVAGVNTVGMRRAGFTAAERLEVNRAFKLLYRSGLNLREAVQEIRRKFPTGPAAEMAAFAEGSKRGLCTGRSEPDPDDAPSEA
jgi:UDP-N-acetylglucosamine acyltransferase